MSRFKGIPAVWEARADLVETMIDSVQLLRTAVPGVDGGSRRVSDDLL